MNRSLPVPLNPASTALAQERTVRNGADVPARGSDAADPPVVRLSRRSVLCAAGAVVLTATGCGGGGHSVGSTSALIQVPASVDLSQIGGTGLKALTVDGANPVIPSSGSYSQTVSKSQAQMHCLVDADNAVRSFAVTSGTSKATLQHNAQSTAIGLVFMTIGIMSTDPGQAQARVSAIESLPSFTALESYLATRLSSQSVTTLAGDSNLQSLVSACISDYWKTQGVGSDASFKPRLTSDASVSATLSGSSYALSNSGWRYVAVAREDLAADGTSLGADLGVLPLTLLAGAHGFSIGNYAVGSVGEPSTITDSHFSSSDTAQVRYWFVGTGYPSGQTPPATIQSVLSDRADANTLFFYVATPFIDLFGGIADSLAKVYHTISEIVGTVLSEASGGIDLDSLMAALHSGDAQGISAAATDLIASLIGLIASFISLAIGGTIAGAVAEIGSAAFTVLASGLAAANLTLVFSHWNSYQDVSAITVKLGGAIGSVS